MEKQLASIQKRLRIKGKRIVQMQNKMQSTLGELENFTSEELDESLKAHQEN